jgi:endonuclease/exonuclease/phosphatase family metal-dependent hydrolase
VRRHGVLTYNYWQPAQNEQGNSHKAYVISDHYPIAATLELPSRTKNENL